MEIQLHELKGGSEKDRKRYMTAIEIAKLVINSQPFKEKVRGFAYLHNGVISSNFKLNQGLTNAQIYTLFMSGYDKFNKEKDGDLDLSVTLYRNRWSSARGYTYGNTFQTWINTYFFFGDENKIIAGIVANIIHEACHNLGFDHAFKNNNTRKFTVPYAVGDIAYELAMDFLGVDQSEKVYKCYRYFYFWKKCSWVDV